MNVGVCYAQADKQLWMRLEVPDNSTVEETIYLSGVLAQHPEIDLTKQKVGIFGAPLPEHVDPEAAHAGHTVGDVDLPALQELLGLGHRQQLGEDRLDLRWAEGGHVGRLQVAVDAQVGR